MFSILTLKTRYILVNRIASFRSCWTDHRDRVQRQFRRNNFWKDLNPLNGSIWKLWIWSLTIHEVILNIWENFKCIGKFDFNDSFICQTQHQWDSLKGWWSRKGDSSMKDSKTSFKSMRACQVGHFFNLHMLLLWKTRTYFKSMRACQVGHIWN